MTGNPLLVIVIGPTGSGKTHLSIALAEQLDGEIVNCDSLQLYRYLDIGTAKPSAEERRGIPHHLIDVLDPDEVFTAGDYARISRPLLAGIAARGRTPIMVGGTGFYLKATLNGLFEGPTRDPGLRERLARRKPASLHRLLKRFDPSSAARIHPNDAQKTIRALEVCLVARRPMTSLFRGNERPLEGFDTLKIGLNPPRAELYERIDQRVVKMFEAGLIEEVENVLRLGFARESKALEAIGYRQALQVLAGELSVDGAIESTRLATRHYAKRQLTWFRREPSVEWLEKCGNEKQTVETAIRLVTDTGKFNKRFFAS